MPGCNSPGFSLEESMRKFNPQHKARKAAATQKEKAKYRDGLGRQRALVSRGVAIAAKEK